MGLGSLFVTNTLQRKLPVFSGSTDPIVGSVLVKLALSKRKGDPTVEELFCPVRVTLIFQGVLETFVDKSSGRAPAAIAEKHYAERKVMFHEEVVFHDGPFRAIAREEIQFPFTTFFPRLADTTKMPTEKEFLKRENSRKPSDQESLGLEKPLPPSIECRFRDGYIVYAHVRALVSYSLQAVVEAPGIDISIFACGAEQALQYYPRSEHHSTLLTTNMFERSLIVSDKAFAAEEQKQKGLKGKAKAIFDNDPCFAFYASCSGVPEQSYPGQSLNIVISIRTDDERTTATLYPEILFNECKISIIASTRLYAVDYQYSSPRVMEDKSTVVELFGSASPRGPFSEANGYSKTISTEPLPYIPNSFESGRLWRSYTVEIKLAFKVGGQKVVASREFSVQILPPLLHGANENTVQPGPSNASMEDNELPPPYEEAGPSNTFEDPEG